MAPRRCQSNFDREAWGQAPGQPNGGGGGGGGGYFGGGSAGFVWTYCGGGGGGGSSWLHPAAIIGSFEGGQAQDSGLMMSSGGAGRGGDEDAFELPNGDLSYRGQHGRVILSW